MSKINVRKATLKSDNIIKSGNPEPKKACFNFIEHVPKAMSPNIYLAAMIGHLLKMMR